MFQPHVDKFYVLNLPRTDDKIHREQGKVIQHVIKPGQMSHKTNMLLIELNFKHFVICLAYF